MLGKTEDKRRRGQQRMRWVDSITDSTDMNLSKFGKIMKVRENPMENPMDRGTWHAAVHGITKSWT